MTENEWTTIKYFKPTENWGDHLKMEYDLIAKLDAWREIIGIPVIVNCAYATSGHSKNSLHYQGRAVDGYIKGVADPREVYKLCLKANLNGIGIYPKWQPSPGFHLDNREKPMRWVSTNGIYAYASNLKPLLA